MLLDSKIIYKMTFYCYYLKFEHLKIIPSCRKYYRGNEKLTQTFRGYSMISVPDGRVCGMLCNR